MDELQHVIGQKQALLAREEVSCPALDYSEGMTAEEQIDWLLNEGWHNKRICFVSPLTSISKDSFEDVDGWTVIDSLHRDDKVIDVIERTNNSICTTWESFCN